MSTPRNLESTVLINESPRPRMLIRGFSSELDVVERLGELVPTHHVCSELNEVRQDEWDLLVTNNSSPTSTPFGTISPHLSIIYLSMPKFSMNRVRFIESRSTWDRVILEKEGHIGRELKRVRNLPAQIAILTHEQLEPTLKSRPSHTYFEYSQRSGGPNIPGSTIGSAPNLEPFIMTGDNKILAGRYKRSSESEAWLLPSDTPDLIAWVRCALAEWHGLAPSRFPGLPNWSDEHQWMTHKERELLQRLDNLNQRREAAIAEFKAEEATLAADLETTRESANCYERALLTTQSDELKYAVMRALNEIGFQVTDADVKAKEREHLEDLRVTDNDVPDWVALVEVKGYGKGAKTEGITQFLRFQPRFQQRSGRPADALWYIVNQFLSRDPSTRPEPLKGQNEDVTAFADARGLIIDTVTLFRWLDALRNGDFTAVDIRRRFRESNGRLGFPT